MKPANIYRFSLLFFTLCYFGFAKWGENKKAGTVSRHCLTFSVSGAENDLEYHLAAPKNANQ
ncbi:MAG: hypothetical protein ACI397_02760 [Paludibacteraceae bacterium]